VSVSVGTTPEELLSLLARRLSDTLGDEVLSLSVHGSWVAGDFTLGRSDLDLLAVLTEDPDEHTLARLATVHASITDSAPEWDNHVEVDYVSRDAVQSVLSGEDTEHQMVRISPGEPIHLVAATRHYLLNWQSSRRHDRPILGRSPSEVLPLIPDGLVRQVVIEHARQWPAWLGDARHPEFQAYAVLTMCRALAFLSTGEQPSKHGAASWGEERLPHWRGLIRWADDVWYRGSQGRTGRLDEVTAFVRETSGLAVYVG
jgi:hypothetical protein